MQRCLHRWLLNAAVATLAACGGGGGSEPEPEPAEELALSQRAVVKLRSTDTGATRWAALAERLRGLEPHTAPDRELLIARPTPEPPLRHAAPEGWSLIDLAVHPSGEFTLVLANTTELRLQRLDAQARVLADQLFTDPAAAQDPLIGDPLGRLGEGLLPQGTRDTVRLAPQGEDVVMALRTGRHAVVAHGLRRDGTGWSPRWRTLVEPGVGIGNIWLTSGSFDTFGSLQAHWRVHLDVAADGRVAVAVAVMLSPTDLAYGHSVHFGEPIADTVLSGVLLTRLAADGRRLSTTVVDTGVRSELFGLRWFGDELLLMGRQRTELRADGSGWDGWLAWVQGSDGRLLRQQAVDVERGDAIFDAAALPGGRWLLAGVTGYVQNPGGRSISEEAAPLLALPARRRSGWRCRRARATTRCALSSAAAAAGGWRACTTGRARTAPMATPHGWSATASCCVRHCRRPERHRQAAVHCTGPLSAAGKGSDIVSMPSSRSASRSSGLAWPRMPRCGSSP
jgi:hypothetical protein